MLTVVALLQLVSEALTLNCALTVPSMVPPADNVQPLKTIIRPAPERPQTFEPPPRVTVAWPGQTWLPSAMFRIASPTAPRTVVIPDAPAPVPLAPPPPR